MKLNVLFVKPAWKAIGAYLNKNLCSVIIRAEPFSLALSSFQFYHREDKTSSVIFGFSV